MLKYPKEKVQSEEITPFLNLLYNYLKYIKIMDWLPGTDSLHFVQVKLTVVGRRRS